MAVRLIVQMQVSCGSSKFKVCYLYDCSSLWLGDGNVWIQIVYSLDLHKFKVQDVPAEVCPEYGQGCTCSILLVRHVWEPDLERQGVSCQNDCHILL